MTIALVQRRWKKNLRNSERLRGMDIYRKLPSDLQELVRTKLTSPTLHDMMIERAIHGMYELWSHRINNSCRSLTTKLDLMIDTLNILTQLNTDILDYRLYRLSMKNYSCISSVESFKNLCIPSYHVAALLELSGKR